MRVLNIFGRGSAAEDTNGTEEAGRVPRGRDFFLDDGDSGTVS